MNWTNIAPLVFAAALALMPIAASAADAVPTEKDPVAAVKRYLDAYYYGPKSWTDYLAMLGLDAVLDASRRGRSVTND